jgi:hypothetical protein
MLLSFLAFELLFLLPTASLVVLCSTASAFTTSTLLLLLLLFITCWLSCPVSICCCWQWFAA